MKPENETLIKEIVVAIRRLVRTVYLDSQQVSRQYGLTGPQSEVLRNLVNWGSLSSADLSRMSHVNPSTVTGIIDRLEKKHLVERVRQEGDRRIALITLTEAGLELGKSAPDPIEKRIIAKLADLDPNHVRILAMAIEQILILLEAEDVENAPVDLSRLIESIVPCAPLAIGETDI
jgi:DNA-binding MarR family transcriptional regulator